MVIFILLYVTIFYYNYLVGDRMERTYDLKLVYDYIWGNDITGYDIEELENDPYFMIQVLERTKDKRVYELCSNSVKTNYTFVRKVIELFSSDLGFLSNVAETYLNSLSDAEKEQGYSYAELNIIMSNLYGRTVNDFSLRAMAFYEVERARALACVSASKHDTIDFSSKKGFIFTACQYESSDIIVDFVANRMINTALYGGENSLEYLIHKRFRSIDEFAVYGEVNFLYDCISDFDQFLGMYAFDPGRSGTFEKFFGEALKSIDIVKYTWQMYMDRLNAWRVDYIERELSNYMLDNGCFGRLSYDDVINYAANKYGVVDLFKKHDLHFDGDYDASKYRVLEVSDINYINRATDLMQQLFREDVIDDSCDDYVEAKNTKVDFEKESRPSVIKFQLSDDNVFKAKK